MNFSRPRICSPPYSNPYNTNCQPVYNVPQPLLGGKYSLCNNGTCQDIQGGTVIYRCPTATTPIGMAPPRY